MPFGDRFESSQALPFKYYDLRSAVTSLADTTLGHMDDLEQFVEGGRLLGVSYWTDRPRELIHPRVVVNQGVAGVYCPVNGKYLSLGNFLRELALGTPNLVVSAYRNNKKPTTISFDKRHRVEISPDLHAYMSRVFVGTRLDAEAEHFRDSFLNGENSLLHTSLPSYRHAIDSVGNAVRHGEVTEIVDTIWMVQDNFIGHAGRGTLGRADVERARPDLIELTKKIAADGTPTSFQRLTEELNEWSADGRLSKTPQLVLARAFAAIHPEKYHIVVDREKQNNVIRWFTRHTGFIDPGGNWANQAAALSAHIVACEISDEQYVRNLFPWFVYCNLASRKSKVEFVPGHTSRVANGTAQVQVGLRTVQYRHNVIQDRLVAQLQDQFGYDAVGSERPTGTGGTADVLVRHRDGGFDLFEIKVAETAAEAVREAVGQLLEYSYRRNGLEARTLVIVSNAPREPVTDEYIGRLRAKFGLPLEYMQVLDE